MMASFALAGVIASFLVIVGVFAVRAYDRISRELAELAILRDGRSIEWGDALVRLRRGDGYVIENLSSLPGRLLWVPFDPDGEIDTYEMIRTGGLIVVCVSAENAEADVRAIGLSDRYKIFIDGFVDYD